MSVFQLDNVGPVLQPSVTQNSNALSRNQGNFSDWLANEISQANNQINSADTKLREFALGQTDNVHEVMMALEKAKLSFELVVEVRNRLLEGYQEIMRMQI